MHYSGVAKFQKSVKAMERLLQLLLCFFLVTWIGACVTMDSPYVQQENEDLARTLDEAIIAIPVKYYKNKEDAPTDYFSWGRMKKVEQELAKIAGDNKIPLVIYIHGCIGYDWNSSHDILFLLNNGYAVLSPYSHARKFRPASCDPSTHTGGFFRGILDFRLAEAKNAYEAAQKIPWVDKQNIFMMGFSEGGITTAKYEWGGLAGRIILGWTCNSGWPEWAGISGPQNEPILAIVSSNDPWFTDFYSHGDCGRYMSSRTNAESIVVNPEYQLHDVQTLPEVQEKILQFLRKNTHH